MAFQYRPAKRERTPLLIGLVGPSGSGKTFSALRLAKGIQSVAGGKIAVIDTEARRALHYADRFDFDHCEFSPPFGSLRYAEALTSAYEYGARTIVLDSTSHEHEGPGGYLETHEEELQRMAGDDYAKRERMKFSAWIKPAGERRRLINTVLQIPANFIFCFRAKEKLALVKNQNGKIEPVAQGWQAIAGDEFVFEMTVRCLLPPGSKGTPDWSDEAFRHGVPKLGEDHRAILPAGKQLDEDVGRALAEWAAGSADGKPASYATAKAAADQGTVALEVWWKQNRPLQKELADWLPGLKAIAATADEAAAA